MTRRTMSFCLVAVFALACGSGCMSYGYRIGGGRAAPVGLPKSDQKLVIRYVGFENMINSEYAVLFCQPIEKALTAERIMRVLVSEHPECFSERGTLPVNLSIAVELEPRPHVGWFVTSLLTGTIIPVRGESCYKLTVNVVTGTPAKQSVLLESTRTIALESHGWHSLTPTGFIPSWFETDTPKEMRVLSFSDEDNVALTSQGQTLLTQEVSRTVAKMIAVADFEDIRRAAVLQALQ